MKNNTETPLYIVRTVDHATQVKESYEYLSLSDAMNHITQIEQDSQEYATTTAEIVYQTLQSK